MQPSSNLLITRTDIRKIRSYISAAKSLPTTTEEVEYQLKTKQTDIPSLEPSDIANLYQKLVNNANSWNLIESSMKRVGSNLVSFSDDLQNFGQDIISTIETMPGYQDYTGTIENMSEEDINSLPAFSIDENERKRFPSIQEAMTFLASSIDNSKENSQDLLVRLQRFGTELGIDIAPNLGAKLKLANSDKINQKITQLNRDIDKQQQRIDEKRREIEPTFIEQLGLFSFGPANSFQYLKKIAPLQDELRAMLDKREQLTEEIKQNNQLAGTLHELHSELDNLLVYVNGAIGSTSQLETLWISTSEYINASQKRLKGIHDFLTLRSFIFSLKNVLKNWKHINANANTILIALN